MSIAIVSYNSYRFYQAFSSVDRLTARCTIKTSPSPGKKNNEPPRFPGDHGAICPGKDPVTNTSIDVGPGGLPLATLGEFNDGDTGARILSAAERGVALTVRDGAGSFPSDNGYDKKRALENYVYPRFPLSEQGGVVSYYVDLYI